VPGWPTRSSSWKRPRRLPASATPACPLNWTRHRPAAACCQTCWPGQGRGRRALDRHARVTAAMLITARRAAVIWAAGGLRRSPAQARRSIVPASHGLWSSGWPAAEFSMSFRHSPDAVSWRQSSGMLWVRAGRAPLSRVRLELRRIGDRRYARGWRRRGIPSCRAVRLPVSSCFGAGAGRTGSLPARRLG
jgi:hypothetical protein